MKRYIYLLQIICLLFTTSIFAEDGERCMVVLMKSGAMINLPISEQPKISFDGTVMRVGEGDYQLENVRKWLIGTLDEIASSIGEAKIDNTIFYRDGVLKVKKGINIRIWNAAGVEMPLFTTIERQGIACIDMQTWPQDVYLIQVGKETIKLRKP